jgi:hypothetical protein
MESSLCKFSTVYEIASLIIASFDKSERYALSYFTGHFVSLVQFERKYLPEFNSNFNFYFGINFYWSRDSSVGIETSYGVDDQWAGVRVPVESKIFTSP